MRRLLALFALLAGFLVAVPASAATPGWQIRPTGTTEQFRGLAAVSASVAWLAGEHGTVLLTTDGGTHWVRRSPHFAPAPELRDIEAYDAVHAVALGIGPGSASAIYTTGDAGRHWTKTFQNADPNAFYDCLAFYGDHRTGLAVSDPPNGKFRILRTTDGGASWSVVRPAGIPAALPGEFGFAASGTCLITSGQDAYLASGGGAKTRVYHSGNGGLTWTAVATPVASGDAAGIFSVAARYGFGVVAVGGDYLNPTGRVAIAATSGTSGRTWTSARVMPGGYRSGVAWIPGSTASLVAVGPSGSDISRDAGRSWTTFDTGSFDNVECATDGTCWASGFAGRVGILG